MHGVGAIHIPLLNRKVKNVSQIYSATPRWIEIYKTHPRCKIDHGNKTVVHEKRGGDGSFPDVNNQYEKDKRERFYEGNFYKEGEPKLTGCCGICRDPRDDDCILVPSSVAPTFIDTTLIPTAQQPAKKYSAIQSRIKYQRGRWNLQPDHRTHGNMSLVKSSRSFTHMRRSGRREEWLAEWRDCPCDFRCPICHSVVTRDKDHLAYERYVERKLSVKHRQLHVQDQEKDN